MPASVVEREARVLARHRKMRGIHGNVFYEEFGHASPDYWMILSTTKFAGCCEGCGGPLAPSGLEVGSDPVSVCCRCGTHYSAGAWGPS